MVSRTAIYSDLDMDLTRNTAGDVTRNTNIDAIINSLNNIVATLQGSRRMLPEFAQDLWHLLFEPLDGETARQIGERLYEAIRIWEDRVVISRVDITPDYDSNIYRARLTFTIKPLQEFEENVDFVLFAQ